MPEPIRSPRQTKAVVKARSNPYARSQQRSQRDVTPVDSITRRSSSLLGAIKSLVTAPLSWLSVMERPLGDHDFTQKRKDPLFERSGTPPKSKRVRRGSPDARDEAPTHRRMITPLWDLGNGVPPARYQHSHSQEDLFHCAPSSFVLHGRTSQSVEPLDSKLSNIHIRRSITREKSMPPPSPFARSLSRISLTPQPSGATFGPSPKRKRDLTAPPSNSLPLVPAVPTFMRPPSVPPSLLFPQSPARQISEGPIMSLLTQSRQSLSPLRETSGMLIGSDSFHPASPPSEVERTFSTLETFRTPLTHFPSQIYPEHRRPRKVHVPLPSKHFSFDERRKKISLDTTPYPTETLGLRKLLQRNKPETDISDLIEEKMTNINAEDVRFEEKADVDANGINVSTKTPTCSLKLDSYSSLRSPAMKLKRTHISAPQLKKPRNKFSLKEDDVDDEISSSIGDLKAHELKIPKPHIAFTRRMSEVGMQTEVSTSTDAFPTPPFLPKLGSSRESLLETGPASISNSAENPSDHREGSLSVTELLPNQNFDITPIKILSGDLPFASTSDGPTPPIPPADIVSSKSFASTCANNPATSVKSFTGPPSIPLFFSPAKTEFTPPPLPADSIFSTTSGTSPISHISPLENLSPSDNALPSLPKIVAAQEHTVPSEFTKVDSFSMHSTGRSLTATALPSAPAADTRKPALMDMGTSTSFKAAGATTHSSGPTNQLTPVVNSSNSFSFGFGLDATRKPTSQPVTAPSSFNFGLPPTSSAGNAEFTFGKLPSEVLSKPPVNIFNFGATPSPTLATGSQTEASPAVPISNSSTALVGTITSAETDTQMDINDQMEESPKRVQEKKDVTVSVPGTSSLNASMSDSPFSFANSATKPSITPFAFGISGNSTANSDIANAGVFSFGDSKTTSTGSGFSFSNTNPTTSGANFNFFPKPPDTSSPNNFGTALTTSASAPTYTFGTPSTFGPPKADKSIPMGNSAPNSPSLFPQQNMASSPSFSFVIPASPTTFAKSDSANPPSSPSQPFQFGTSSSASSHQPGPIFTLGAATNTPPRKLKGLPQRRRK